MARIESLLSARLFLVPQLVEDRIYFISNINGRNSLYAMNYGGSVPEPLLPPHIALQNPHLMGGASFVVFPKLNQILVMIDQDGDESYKPMLVSTDGGYPEPFEGALFDGYNVSIGGPDLESNQLFLIAQSQSEPLVKSYLANLESGDIVQISEGMYGMIPQGTTKKYDKFVLAEQFGIGDSVLYIQSLGEASPTHFYGIPAQERTPETEVPQTAIGSIVFDDDESGMFFTSILFDDQFSVGHMPFDSAEPSALSINGLVHEGQGELENLESLGNGRYLLHYNIDGCSWVYEATIDQSEMTVTANHVLVGQGTLSNGVLESIQYEKNSDRYAISFSTATSPTQIYTLEGEDRNNLIRHTNERLLGISSSNLSSGEDYSYESFDGLRISARLYMPAEELGFEGKRPLIYYIHGGPQGQERPDFAWFSMPFIQFLTLNGFAVFVPNVRGSTGYGFAYMNHVVRDWGGQDRLDHVHAMQEVLPKDDRIDTERAAVVGRSYGGYMTLTLAGRHPELWKAAIDMFGPYDLLTFASRVPETWKPFIKLLVGDPETEQDFLTERSPKSYIQQLSCPMLVVQGKNDPRVIEKESAELVDMLNDLGKDVDYLMFEDEGHDVLKYENRVTVYNRMTDFFKKHL